MMRVAIADAVAEIAAHEEVAPFVLAPFAHLRSASETVDLHIEVEPLREAVDAPDTGAITSTDDTITYRHPHSVSVLDRRTNRIRARVRNADGVAPWHRAKPLQVPLSIFFADRGVDFVHAGLISLHGTGALITGMGGSGKSTLTLASLLEGLDLLGDDCVAVRGTEGFSIYGSASVERDHLERFPQFAPDANLGGKTVLPLAELFPERMAAKTTIRAIVLPRVTHGEHVTIAPATAKEALLALAPSSILKRAVPAAAALARMTRLVREVPAFRLEMGPIAEIGPRIRELLEGLQS
jgi:hypothetical protein